MDATNGQKPLGGHIPTGGGTGMDKSKEWQMELLMEKLRSKSSALKSLVETAKNLRMAMLDKRFAIDSVEKGQLQKCLDTLQHSIKVTSLQSMVERLESLTRQLGLKFAMVPSGTETGLFISSDMFFLEVLLEPSGVVKDVKIQHEGKNEQQSCEELVSCLSRGDFLDFTAQLEGLASIYQLNADKKVKCKAFSALQSLEADLGGLAQLQTFMKEPFNLVHKSPVGILERRKGGHAMKLTYFVSPYDLIDLDTRTCDQLTPDAVTSRKIGHSVTVCLEGSTAHKLPTTPILTVNRSSTGKSTPSYAPLTSSNSSMLPACFVLKLAKKMPMCVDLVQQIQKVTELDCSDVSTPQPLLSLIVQHSSSGHLDCKNNRGLYVTLPDQQHCYFMTENRSMEGVLVGSIPFTHPAHVPRILGFLRQQALFNTLLTSCVRPMARQELEHTTMLEVSALSWQHVSISLEHPFEETMATAELDLSDISAVKCKLYGVSVANTEQTSDAISKVLQRCLNIPVTMRALIKTWEGGSTATLGTGSGGTTNGGNYSVNLQGPQNGHDNNATMDFTNGDANIKTEPGLNGNGRQQNTQQQQSFLDAGAENSIGFPSFSGQSDTSAMLNPLQLGALLQGKSSPVGGSSSSSSERSKKNRKRKTDGIWRSPKSKGDDSEILLESSSSDSTPLGTPSRDNANGTRTPTPTAVSLVGGLDLSNLEVSDVVSDTRSSTDYDVDNESEVMEVHDDDYEILKKDRKSRKNREDKKSPIFDDKANLVPSSLSITQITNSGVTITPASYNTVLPSISLERRPGIELIPITPTSLSSSVTITPITPTTIKPINPDDRRERKKTSEEKSRLEKRRKRKKEESPMGPPEKLPLKQPDPLSKPISVSIKPEPQIGSRPSSPAALKRFNPSPTHTSPLALVGKSSPTVKSTSSSSSGSSTPSKSMPSPKHSPVYSSPKHSSSVPASASPKHGTSSPKHGSSASSGKPSMSALKSAANSPSSSGKGDGKPKTKDPNREKDRKPALFSSSQSPKTKSSNKLKIEAMTTSDSPALPSGSSTPPSVGSDLSKSLMQQQARNRKGSLSAVIDKLKNAQHVTDEGNGKSEGTKERAANKEGKTVGKGSPSMESKNPAEYMVKHSSDGMKITINKTRAKDSKGGKVGGRDSMTSSSGTGSPKIHTGLKPGVNSGPASKKPQSQSSVKVSGQQMNTSKVSAPGKASGCKSTSSGAGILSKTTSKSSGSPKMSSSGATDLSRSREKSRVPKSGDKSGGLFGKDSRKASPSPLREESETERAFKLLAAHASMPSVPPQMLVEGLIKQQLDTNFQIPKLSARNADAGDKKGSDKGDHSSKGVEGASKIDKITSGMSSVSNLSSISNISNVQNVNLSKSEGDRRDVQKSDSTNVGPLNLNALDASMKLTGVPNVPVHDDVPTNLSMQADLEVRDVKDLTVSRSQSAQYLKGDDSAGHGDVEVPAKTFSGSSGGSVTSGTSESLNLSTKPADAALSKYKSEERKSGEKSKYESIGSLTSGSSSSVIDVPVKATTPVPRESEVNDMLLDFSTPKDVGKSLSTIPERAMSLQAPTRRNTPPPPPPPPPPTFPPSPSVSVHILKSPVPSPRVIPSPHAASPCITDDELMDEALVGLGK